MYQLHRKIGGIFMPGMFSLILKNIIRKPATRLYPTIKREPFERTRGRLFFNEDPCIYCGICMRTCPADAIKVTRNEQLWELNAFRCIICGECVNKCPKKCLSITNERRNPSSSKKYVYMKRKVIDESAGTTA
jgi:ech hydrogenase subunit F